MPLIQDSPFDSEILGCKVGKAAFDGNEILSDIDHDLLTDPHEMLFVFSPVDAKYSTFLESKQFHFISIRATYSIPISITDIKNVNSISIVRWSQEKPTLIPDDLQNLIQTISQTSRYFRDPDISKGSAIKLYQSWLMNSLYNNYVDEIFLAYSQNKLAGLLSIKIKDGSAFIDLVGVLPEYQHSGIGSQLINQAKSWLCGKVKTLMAVTEGENIPAIRFYTKHGFKLDKVELVYHYHKTGSVKGN